MKLYEVLEWLWHILVIIFMFAQWRVNYHQNKLNTILLNRERKG